MYGTGFKALSCRCRRTAPKPKDDASADTTVGNTGLYGQSVSPEVKSVFNSCPLVTTAQKVMQWSHLVGKVGS